MAAEDLLVVWRSGKIVASVGTWGVVASRYRSAPTVLTERFNLALAQLRIPHLEILAPSQFTHD